MNLTCKVCDAELSALLSPYESFEVQAKRLTERLCSKFCANKKGA